MQQILYETESLMIVKTIRNYVILNKRDRIAVLIRHALWEVYSKYYGHDIVLLIKNLFETANKIKRICLTVQPR